MNQHEFVSIEDKFKRHNNGRDYISTLDSALDKLKKSGRKILSFSRYRGYWAIKLMRQDD